MASQPTTIFDVLERADEILAAVTMTAQTIPQFQGFVQAQTALLNNVLQQVVALQQQVTSESTEISNGAQLLQAIIAAMGTASQQNEMVGLLQQILTAIESGGGPFSNFKPIRITVGRPTDFIGGKMANTQLPNNVVRQMDILVEDAAGNKVPAPANDTFTVAANNPTIMAATFLAGSASHSGNPAVQINALVQSATGANGPSFTLSDSAGLQSFTETFDVVENQTPTQLAVDQTAPFDQPQPVPTTPGPG